MMNITVFNGSPRAERGNTHIMVEAFSKGARKADAHIETVFLREKEINHCQGCFTCWGESNTCILDDDMTDLIEKYMGSDVVIFATPVYVDNVTGIMKQFMDRLIPILDYHMITDENGETVHKKRYETYPKLMVMANCGYPEQSHFQVLHLLFERIARNFHSQIIAEIYRGQGELLGVEHPRLEPVISAYTSLLQKAGEEIVENLKLSEETKTALNQPLVPHDLYRKGVNEGLGAVMSGE
jgi:multimeric flavodoxin WrbA